MTAPVADATGPAAPPPPTEPQRKPKAATRKRMSLWDRVRLLLLFVIAWLIIVWASMADNPLLPFSDAALIQLRDSQWLLWLAGLEVLRQIHFLVSEQSAGLPPLLVGEGVRRVQPRGPPPVLRLDPVPAGPAHQARLCSWCCSRSWPAQILDTSPILAIFQAPGAALSRRCR